MGKAQTRITQTDEQNKIKMRDREQYGLTRMHRAGTPTRTSTSSMFKTSPTNIATSGLKPSGDTMTGPIAFLQAAAVVSGPDSSHITIDISSAGAYSSYVVLPFGAIQTYVTIKGATHDGQLLFLQANGGTHTISNANNISPINATTSFTWTNQDFIILMFNSLIGAVGGTWIQVTAPIASGGGGGANTALSNLITTSINQNLLPQANQTIGDSTHFWFGAYISQMFLGNINTHMEIAGSGDWNFTVPSSHAFLFTVGTSVFMRANFSSSGLLELTNGAALGITPTVGNNFTMFKLSGSGNPVELSCTDGIQFDNAINVHYLQTSANPYNITDNDTVIALLAPSTVNLQPATPRKGRLLKIIADGGTVTLVRSGTDTIVLKTGTVTSVSFGGPGYQVMEFVSNGAGIWAETFRNF